MEKRIGVHLRQPINSKIQTPYVQFFVVGPQNYTTVEWLNTHEKRLEFSKDKRIKIVHGSYVDHPWDDGKIAIYNIRRELKICEEIGAMGLIVHVPSREESIDRVIRKLLEGKPRDIKLILETNARGTWSSSDVNKLLLEIKKFDDVILCIDTAHIWSAGVSLTTSDDVNEWLGSIENHDKIGLIHLNDNRNSLGSGRDIHDSILPGVGQIWKNDNSGLVRLLQILECPVILERDSDAHLQEEIEYLKNIIY